MDELAKRAESLTKVKIDNLNVQSWISGGTYKVTGKIKKFDLGDIKFPGQEKLETNRDAFFHFNPRNWNQEEPEIRNYFNEPTGLLTDLQDKTLVVCINGYTPADANAPTYQGKIPGQFEVAFVKCINI
ncbi:Oidioi.mRNA.OKI2018_I69.chr1.g435.t1.cds [Oikopleura dioica]|uniref:Oidioi.mRNA.OKI2018_I69.chr1.g435.t1.cds n=1 Tax=Oikopleura dioica TaxID=34765 RepID=A0ABN7SJU4_OIKDI|nr:Oidioi.mRNA.OKI2018_I69.chr1.g435.t1.cds [Oikopleura dioica]